MRFDENPGGDACRGGRPQTGAGGVCANADETLGEMFLEEKVAHCDRYQGLSHDVQLSEALFQS